MTPAQVAKRNRMRIVLAFAAVYVLWGSTYLFIKYATEAIPPFLLGFLRFIIAGGLLYAAARWRGAARATAHEWKLAALSGILMLGVGNGAVMWSVQRIPTGVAALIVSSTPIWVVVLDWLRPRGVRPKRSMFVGLALGLIGMVILIGPRAIIGEGHVDEIGAGVLIAGSIGWALGTLVTRHTDRPGSPLVFASLQMMVAAVAMLVISVGLAEFPRFSVEDLTARALWSVVYLVIAGSIIGFTAYVYLLGVVSAAKASTYAYVNPIIAVLLGWAFANEPLGLRTVVAAGVILAGVAIITATQGSSGSSTGEHPLPRADEPKRNAA
jgi:drug/metabolite transporter (DMT)-like permease